MEKNLQTFSHDDFETLFKKEFKGLCFFSMKYVKDLDAARNIVQDAFITLWEKRESLDMDKSVKSYLATIIYSRSLNYLRDNKKFDKDLLACEGLVIEGEDHADSRILSSELRHNIDSAIAELPEKCREVFMLSRFEHKKYHEIAEILGISVKTVEAQMSKALQHLRMRLAPFMFWLILVYFEQNMFFYN